MSFLHGVETIEAIVGPRQVTVVKSGVIGLVGISPKGVKNQLIQVLGDTDAAQFGSSLPGFTIPQALEAIIKQGAGLIIVVNTFDSETNTKTNTAEVLVAVSGRKTKTLDAPLSDFVLTNNGATVTYDVDDDYTVDDFGNIVIKNNAIAEGALLKATYKTLDLSTVNNAQIIGEVDGETNARSGMKAWDLCFSTFGYNPKILIAPGFSSVVAIAAELRTYVTKFRAICLTDSPEGTTPAVAIAGRGPGGVINFNTSDKRTGLLYPMLKVTDPNPGNAVNGVSPDINGYYSSFFAGLMAYVDQTEGYWVSASNHEIKGITGTERALSASINDPNTEANQLNGAGIITQFSSFGTGLRSWGNRSAAYPSSNAVDNFLAVRRTADIIEESIELAQLPFIDQPINKATIDAVRETVNAFLRTLVGRGAILDGECKYIPADNPAEELAAGHVTYSYTFLPPSPMERITMKATIDINLLKVLGAN